MCPWESIFYGFPMRKTDQYNYRYFFKAELPQEGILFRTHFPSLGIFVNKKVGNQKNNTTFIISVLKVVY